MAHPPDCTCAACGSPTKLLDYGFQLPDCIWKLPANERSKRNTTSHAFLAKQRFIRALLPIRLEDGDELRYGFWVEVDIPTFDRVVDCWDDDTRYAQLEFEGTLANAGPPWGSTIVGVEVQLHVRDPKGRPFVRSSRTPWLQQLLTDGWSDADYAAFANAVMRQ